MSDESVLKEIAYRSLSFKDKEASKKAWEALRLMDFDPAQPFHHERAGYYGKSVINYLEHAAISNTVMLTSMLEAGVNPDQGSEPGYYTPFMMALGKNEIPNAWLLAQHGAHWSWPISKEILERTSFLEGETNTFVLLMQKMRYFCEEKDPALEQQWLDFLDLGIKHLKQHVSEAEKKELLSESLIALASHSHEEYRREFITKTVKKLKNEGADPLLVPSKKDDLKDLPLKSSAVQILFAQTLERRAWKIKNASTIWSEWKKEWPAELEEGSQKLAAIVGRVLQESYLRGYFKQKASQFVIQEMQPLLKDIIKYDPFESISALNPKIKTSFAQGVGMMAGARCEESHFQQASELLKRWMLECKSKKIEWDRHKMATQLAEGAASYSIKKESSATSVYEAHSRRYHASEKDAWISQDEMKRALSRLNALLSLDPELEKLKATSFKKLMEQWCKNTADIKNSTTTLELLIKGFPAHVETLVEQINAGVSEGWLSLADRKKCGQLLEKQCQIVLKHELLSKPSAGSPYATVFTALEKTLLTVVSIPAATSELKAGPTKRL